MTRSSSATELRTLGEGLEFPEGPVALGDGLVLLIEMFAGPLVLLFLRRSIAMGISLTRTVTHSERAIYPILRQALRL
jgi:hypothetical protein